jgi:hypothetical protein
VDDTTEFRIAAVREAAPVLKTYQCGTCRALGRIVTNPESATQGQCSPRGSNSHYPPRAPAAPGVPAARGRTARATTVLARVREPALLIAHPFRVGLRGERSSPAAGAWLASGKFQLHCVARTRLLPVVSSGSRNIPDPRRPW